MCRVLFCFRPWLAGPGSPLPYLRRVVCSRSSSRPLLSHWSPCAWSRAPSRRFGQYVGGCHICWRSRSGWSVGDISDATVSPANRLAARESPWHRVSPAGRASFSRFRPNYDHWAVRVVSALVAHRTECELLAPSKSPRADNQQVGTSTRIDEHFRCRRVRDAPNDLNSGLEFPGQGNRPIEDRRLLLFGSLDEIRHHFAGEPCVHDFEGGVEKTCVGRRPPKRFHRRS